VGTAARYAFLLLVLARSCRIVSARCTGRRVSNEKMKREEGERQSGVGGRDGDGVGETGKRKPRVELLLLLHAKCHFLFVIHLLFLPFSPRAYLYPVSYVVYVRHVRVLRNDISKLRAYPSQDRFPSTRKSVYRFSFFVKISKFALKGCCLS